MVEPRNVFVFDHYHFPSPSQKSRGVFHSLELGSFISPARRVGRRQRIGTPYLAVNRHLGVIPQLVPETTHIGRLGDWTGSEHVPGRKQTSHVVFQRDIVAIFDEQFSELRFDSPARRTDRICKVNDAYFFLFHLTAGDAALSHIAAEFETGQPRGLTKSEPDSTFTVPTNTLIALRCYPQSLLERCFSVGMESA